MISLGYFQQINATNDFSPLFPTNLLLEIADSAQMNRLVYSFSLGPHRLEIHSTARYSRVVGIHFLSKTHTQYSRRN